MDDRTTTAVSSKQADKQRRYRRLKAAGLCTECGKAPPVAGKLKCGPCFARYRKIARDTYKKRYEGRRAAGLCVLCSEPAIAGCRCPACVQKQKLKLRNDAKRAQAKRRNSGLCVLCGTTPVPEGKRTCKKCLDRGRQYRAVAYPKLRDAAFMAYGGYRCSCPGCTVTESEFLQIDHIDGDGAEHRKNDRAAYKIFYWLKKHNYPPGFRVLCANCNWSRGVHGYCPHQHDTEVDNADKASTGPAPNA